MSLTQEVFPDYPLHGMEVSIANLHHRYHCLSVYCVYLFVFWASLPLYKDTNSTTTSTLSVWLLLYPFQGPTWKIKIYLMILKRGFKAGNLHSWVTAWETTHRTMKGREEWGFRGGEGRGTGEGRGVSANFAPGLQPWLLGGGRQPQVSLRAQWSCLCPEPGGALLNMPHSEAHSTSHTGGQCAQTPFSLTGSGLRFLIPY